jgi:hypothetical protein
MAHGTYGDKRSGSTASALRMQKMVDKLNSPFKKKKRVKVKSKKEYGGYKEKTVDVYKVNSTRDDLRALQGQKVKSKEIVKKMKNYDEEKDGNEITYGNESMRKSVRKYSNGKLTQKKIYVKGKIKPYKD